MAEKVKIILEVDDSGSAKVVDQLNDKINDTGKTAEKTQSKFSQLGSQLAGIKGPVGQAVQGIQGLGIAFKALIANPVGLFITAIVTALTALYKAFTSTKAGAETFQQIMDAIGASMDVIRDRTLQFGKGLKEIFSGDIRKGIDSIKNSFTGLGDEISREAKEAANLRKELQKITDDERELNKSRAEQNRLIADAKLRINDENLSYGERLKALEQVRKAEVQLAQDEEKLAKRKYDAIVAQNALSDSSQEALDAEAAAFIELQNAQVASLAKQKELFDQEKSLRDRQKNEQKQAAAEQEAKRKEEAERIASMQEEEFQAWLAQETARYEYAEQLRQEAAKKEEEDYQQWLAQEIANYEYREKLAEDEAKKQKELDEQVAESKRQLNDAIKMGLQGLADVVGQNSQFGKAVAIAQALISTYEGASKALGQGGIFGPIAAAGVIASGIANVRAITSTTLPSPPSGGGGGGAAMPSMPSVGIIQGQMSQTSQLQAELNSQMRKPTRAYVVGQNVTSQQSLDRHILENATL